MDIMQNIILTVCVLGSSLFGVIYHAQEKNKLKKTINELLGNPKIYREARRNFLVSEQK